MSPAAAVAIARMYQATDVRDALPLIQAPTLVTYLAEDKVSDAREGRYIAAHIPGATSHEVPGDDHMWRLRASEVGAVVEEFLAFREEEVAFERMLATVLFTDIVGSTDRAVELGDRGWRELLERHHATVRALLGRYRGTEVVTTGDGFLATFDGPARAIRCARAITAAMDPIGIQVRAGIHTGEIETIGDDVGGVAVHIGARVAAIAGPSEVLVSSTVKDLVAGSGLTFEDAGDHELKGVPDQWHLYRVTA